MPVTSCPSTLDLLSSRIGSDAILQFLRTGHLRLGLGTVIPSGVDQMAAALARSVVTERPAIAFALPRGKHSLANFLGLYFALGRMGFGGRSSYLPLSGSIAVSTNNRELRDVGALLDLVGDRPSDAELSIMRMAPGRPRADGRVTPCAMDLQSSERFGGLSSADRHLLLHLPKYRPEVARNTISFSVVDATATSAAGWAATLDWNTRAERRQVWVAELGDENFAAFCSNADIPLWRFDWETIGGAIGLWGAGQGGLTTASLCERNCQPSFELIPVDDGDANDELAKLERCFASFHRKAAKVTADPPPVIRQSRQLFYLLARLAAPLTVYDSVALNTPRALHTATALKRVREASDGQWFGPWRKLDQDWAAVRGGLTSLHQRILDEDPKYWDLLALIQRERARFARRKLVIRCTTKVEARALAAALVTDAMVTPDELDVGGFIDIRWFGVQSAALPAGLTRRKVLTVLTEPPSPLRGGPYLSAEEGCVEALLYPVQQRRFCQLAERTATTCSGSRRNMDVLRTVRFGVNGDAGEYACASPAISTSEPFFIPKRRTSKVTDLGESVDRMRDHWEEYIGLGSDRDETASTDAAEAGGVNTSVGGGPTLAVLAAFETGERVFFDADGRVDVVMRDDHLLPTPVTRLRPGQNVVLIEGMERGSALTDLFDAWEETYGPGQVFGTLYRRALEAAVENLGGELGLANKLGVEVTTVRTWRSGLRVAPGNAEHLRAILEFSDIGPAKQNFRNIELYVRRVRGKHKQLGRIFNRAVSETVIDPGGPEQRKLEQETGLDLTPILSAVRRLTVAYVIDRPKPVPRGLLGRFLSTEDATVKGIE